MRTERAQSWVPSIEPIRGGGAVPEWSLGDRLRKAREYAGLGQSELADLVTVQRSTVSAAENGHRRPTSATVRLWAIATGVNVEWIENGETPPSIEDGVSESYTPRDLNPEPTDFGPGAVVTALWTAVPGGDAA